MTTETFKSKVPIKKIADRRAVASRAIPKKSGYQLYEEQRKKDDLNFSTNIEIMSYKQKVEKILLKLDKDNKYYSFIISLAIN